MIFAACLRRKSYLPITRKRGRTLAHAQHHLPSPSLLNDDNVVTALFLTQAYHISTVPVGCGRLRGDDRHAGYAAAVLFMVSLQWVAFCGICIPAQNLVDCVYDTLATLGNAYHRSPQSRLAGDSPRLNAMAYVGASPILECVQSKLECHLFNPSVNNISAPKGKALAGTFRLHLSHALWRIRALTVWIEWFLSF